MGAVMSGNDGFKKYSESQPQQNESQKYFGKEYSESYNAERGYGLDSSTIDSLFQRSCRIQKTQEAVNRYMVYQVVDYYRDNIMEFGEWLRNSNSISSFL